LLYDFKYNAHLLTTPIYFHVGTNDVVISVSELKQFYEKLKCEKKITEYPNARHELHTDRTQEVFQNTLSWIQEKLQNAPKLGKIEFESLKSGFLKHKEPKNKKAMVVIAVILYYLIGYLLMVSNVIYKKRHGQQLISWPFALLYRFLKKKK